MVRSLILAAAFAALPTFASAFCVDIWANNLSPREVAIAEGVVGRVINNPLPENGHIRKCSGQDNSFRAQQAEKEVQRRNDAWAEFARTTGTDIIRQRIVETAGPCPTILEDLSRQRPRAGQAVEVSCTNGNVYSLSNWEDERNRQEPLLKYVVIRQIR
ncbi:hypothetical protein [Mameliella sp.]|uniref:hypothetical protein n=1 Tax=Mameliella sp. TaxID=1924940 RepID=UPI003B50BCE5